MYKRVISKRKKIDSLSIKVLVSIFACSTLFRPANTFVLGIPSAIIPDLQSNSNSLPGATTFSNNIPSSPFDQGSRAGSPPSTKMFQHKKEAVSTFAGRISPVLSKLVITKEKAQAISMAIRAIVEPADVIFIVFIGWFLVPLVRVPYEKFFAQKFIVEIDKSKGGTSQVSETKFYKPFHDSKLYFYLNLLAEAGQIAGVIYLVDCLAISLGVLGFTEIQNHISKLFAKTIYTVWIFTRVNVFRKFLVSKAFSTYDTHVLGRSYRNQKNISVLMEKERKRRNLSRTNAVNNILDIVFWGIFISSLLDVLNIQAGVFLNSFFTVGGVGTIVLSFASKDIAMQFVSGFALQASDKVYEGEEVIFGNGVSGVICKMGILETLVKQNGEMITAIPNKDLANQRITNVSRLKFSQVKQILRFDYEDASKMPAVIEEIRKEIRETCPQVVKDGSRPLRVVWSDFGNNSLEVTVDVRINTPPTGDIYHEGKQKILIAIHTALKRLDMNLVPLESIRYTGMDKKTKR